jgi:cardiolipin synthase
MAHPKPARRSASGIRGFAATHPKWQTALLAIGLLALLTVAGGLFFRVGDAPKEIVVAAEVPPVSSPAFAIALSHLVNGPVEQGGSVEILNNGDAFLASLLRSIHGASSTINFLAFMWNDGSFSDRVLEALIAKQREGVAVRVLLDGLGARSSPDDLFEALEESGGKVERFRMPRFGSLTRFHRRNHRRSIVIDGAVGYVGGMAIYDKWLGNARSPDEWRDMMFKVTGPLARSLQAAFVDSWVGSSGEILVGPAFYALDEPAGGGVDRYIHLVNSPADDDASMAYFYLLPILAAKEKVYITTPYFIPDQPLKEALRSQARNGVDVRLLLPGEHIDNASVRYSAQTHYEDLIESGVKVYEYQPTFIHSKTVVIDGAWSIIGSPNLNVRSRQLDEENAYGILDADLASALERTFFEDLKRSEAISLDEWRKRSPLLRLVQRLSRVLDEQS